MCGSRAGLSFTEKEKSLPDTGNRSSIILVDVTILADRNVTPEVAEKEKYKTTYRDAMNVGCKLY